MKIEELKNKIGFKTTRDASGNQVLQGGITFIAQHLIPEDCERVVRLAAEKQIIETILTTLYEDRTDEVNECITTLINVGTTHKEKIAARNTLMKLAKYTIPQ